MRGKKIFQSMKVKAKGGERKKKDKRKEGRGEKLKE